MQLEIEEAALSKENDEISKTRLDELKSEKAELKSKFDSMKAKWENEKNAIGKGQKLREEIELDYAKDFLDVQHLNAAGARKVSRYLAKYLKKNYHLEDHREDPAYADWNADAAMYEIYAKAGLANMEELTDEADDEAEDE